MVKHNLKSIVTADKSWLHHYARPRNQEVFSHEKKAKIVKSSENRDHRTIYPHAVLELTAVTDQYYITVLQTLTEHIERKRLGAVYIMVMHVFWFATLLPII